MRRSRAAAPCACADARTARRRAARRDAGNRFARVAAADRRAWRGLRRERCAGERECLDQMRDLLAGQSVVAMPPLRVHVEQAAFDEPAQMRTCAGRCDAGKFAEFAGRPRTAVHQREQDAGARRLGEQGADFGETVAGRGSAHHDDSLARSASARFVAHRNIVATIACTISGIRTATLAPRLARPMRGLSTTIERGTSASPRSWDIAPACTDQRRPDPPTIQHVCRDEPHD
jgi:hypothetical protein